jgi:hypothetical protein
MTYWGASEAREFVSSLCRMLGSISYGSKHFARMKKIVPLSTWHCNNLSVGVRKIFRQVKTTLMTCQNARQTHDPRS